MNDSVSQESIAAAKLHRDTERRKVEAVNPGLRITDDGALVLPTPHRAACGLCNYVAFAKRDGQAVNSVAAHIIRVHFPQQKGAA